MRVALIIGLRPESEPRVGFSWLAHLARRAGAARAFSRELPRGRKRGKRRARPTNLRSSPGRSSRPNAARSSSAAAPGGSNIGDAPSLLNASYTSTAEVHIPEGGCQNAD